MQGFYCLGKYILYYLFPVSKFKSHMIIGATKPLGMNLSLPNRECLLMLLYDVLFVCQVLNHMGLQNLKTEVDQSLEPGRDLRANEKNLFQASGNTWEDFINQCSLIV